MFWNKPSLPVTANDQEWTEDALLWIREQFGEEFLKTVSIKTPSTKYFNRKFKGTEEDAAFALERICEYMSVDPGTVYLSFYGQEDLGEKYQLPRKGGAPKNPAGLYKEWAEGYTEISLDLKGLDNPVSLISTLAHEVAHIKLLGEKRIRVNHEPLTDLTAIAFGFGVFQGNTVFEMKQWRGSRLQGWSMKRKGYLPEQVIAFAMAWMAHYQGDKDCVWSSYLNKTMTRFFEQSRKYMLKYPEKIRFDTKSSDLPFRELQAVTAEQKPPAGISYDKAEFENPVIAEPVPLPEIAGKWLGVLVYGPTHYPRHKGSKLYFSMELNVQGEDEFEGTARDLEGLGMNEFPASVKGYLRNGKISFIKQYQFVDEHDPTKKTKTRILKPGPEIFYSAVFNHLKGEFEGDWFLILNSEQRGSGTWKMKKDE